MAYEEKLPGDYIAGFVDGEGCFALKFSKETKRNRPGSPVYYRWAAEFAITLGDRDIGILKQLQKSIGIGSIYNYTIWKSNMQFDILFKILKI